MNGDLLGAALGGDMLGARQRRPATVTGKPDKIVRHQGHGAPRALLPGRVGRGINDNLADHLPTSMARIATRNEKPRQRIGHHRSFGLGSVIVQVPQCGSHAPPTLYRGGELSCGPPRLALFSIDLCTLLGSNPSNPPTSIDHKRRSRGRGHLELLDRADDQARDLHL